MFMTFLFKLTIAFLEVVYIHMKNCFIYSKPFFWFDSTILAFDVWETVANLASFFAQVLILCLSGNDSIALPFFNHLQLYYWEKVNSKHLKRFKSGFRTLNRIYRKSFDWPIVFLDSRKDSDVSKYLMRFSLYQTFEDLFLQRSHSSSMEVTAIQHLKVVESYCSQQNVQNYGESKDEMPWWIVRWSWVQRTVECFVYGWAGASECLNLSFIVWLNSLYSVLYTMSWSSTL